MRRRGARDGRLDLSYRWWDIVRVGVLAVGSAREPLMARARRLLLGVVLLVGGLVLAFWGLFAVVYTGENNNDNTYVTLFGHRTDAHLAGAVALVLALAAVAGSLRLIKRRN